MVAGHLREQNGKYQMILSWKGTDGKRKTKSVSTGLPVKGNKRRAEEMLKITCREFNPDNSKDNANMLVSDFLAKWLKDKASTMGASRFANYAYNVKADITPYFETHPIMLPELSADALSAFFAYERNENKVPVQILLELHEALLVGLGYAVELGWISDNPVELVNPCENDSQLLFTQFLLDWLAMMKKSVAPTTHSGYTKCIKFHIIPYFNAKHPGLKLSHVTPKHIQDYYTYEMEERGLSANTILRRQANIRKALQYAYKTGLISGNPADKIERPKAEKFTGTFYQADELNSLFQAFRNDPLELAVILATYYGLRRSELIGLRWDAVDFEKKTLTVKHTVHQTNIDGKWQIVAQDRTKTKSSFRTLPLVGPIETLLLNEKARQQQNHRLCSTCYCTEFSDYIFLNDIGELIKPDFVSKHFAFIVQKHNLKKLRFHDLRHSCASLLFANGVSMKEIQAWLGHSTLGTTANIYTHMDEDKKLDSANAITPVLKF